MRLSRTTRRLEALLLLDTSIPLWGTSNGWRMTWSGFWGTRNLIWGLAKRQGELSNHLEGPHNLLFCTFMILMFLFLNLTKDWNVSNPLWKQTYYLLIWAMRESFFIIIAYFHLIYYFFFLFFFFPFHVIFSHDVRSRIFTMPMVFSPNFCLNHPFGFSI